ncbi:MAG TPA: tRNA (adenosine(37)-N6)-threonylcarbamoyltransferase complex transferase subunit TsaD [Candidatus Omnitrophota bacterium]|nr:tRNA (adenosine(37)-N6)-threonylcarbamoyltransferase complex transferase subunit TsaD [Candidatus Omnitrophota bacterium]
MITIGIETSCDETAIAVVKDGKVLSNEVSSSVHLHSQYGGVVPEIASRYHTEYIYTVFKKSMDDAGLTPKDIELIAVTKGPGLPGSLLVGISFAKSLSYALNIPLVGVNHLYSHVFSAFIGKNVKVQDMLPFTGMIISGGHTTIYDFSDILRGDILGETLDDAVGEAYDKVAKILGLGYPGGPVVEERAKRNGGRQEIKFPRSFMKESPGIDFSFSGIKTAIMYYWKDAKKTEDEKDRVCFSFQRAVTDIIDRKIADAADRTGMKRFVVGGGVLCNSAIRGVVEERCREEGVELFMPDRQYCTDNGAMTAFLGEMLYIKGVKSDLYLNVEI